MAITIDGVKRKVVCDMGYNHSVGAYVKEVEIDGEFKIAVKRGGAWRLWGAGDRTKPLREAVARGWPKNE